MLANLQACEQAPRLLMQATSRKEEGVEAYKIDASRDPDAFPPPNWPSQSLTDLIAVTFAGLMIDVADHPGLSASDRRKAVDIMTAREHFSSVVVADFEYEVNDGDLPDVLCMVSTRWMTNSSTFALCAYGEMNLEQETTF